MTTDSNYASPCYFPIDTSAPRAVPAPNAKALPPFSTTLHTRACWSFGPLEVCAEYSNGGIDFEVKLAGQRIGGGRLDSNNATFSVGVDLGLVKAGVTLTADFNARQLVAAGEACVRDWLGRWQCQGFNEVILRW